MVAGNHKENVPCEAHKPIPNLQTVGHIFCPSFNLSLILDAFAL